MLMVMTIEIPLPMPLSVICSPSHMSSSVPAEQAHDGGEFKREAGCGTSAPYWLVIAVDAGEELAGLGVLELLGVEVALEETDEDRGVAGVLRDLLAAAFLARELAQAGDDGGHQLEHDAGADVRDDAEGEDGAILQRAAAEQIEEADDGIFLLGDI
jgi:hypothetical protein